MANMLVNLPVPWSLGLLDRKPKPWKPWKAPRFFTAKTPRCTGIAFPGCYLLKKATVKLLSGSTEQYNLMIKEKAGEKNGNSWGSLLLKKKVGEMSSDEKYTRIPSYWLRIGSLGNECIHICIFLVKPGCFMKNDPV